jgi:hypothetical protein
MPGSCQFRAVHKSGVNLTSAIWNQAVLLGDALVLPLSAERGPSWRCGRGFRFRFDHDGFGVPLDKRLHETVLDRADATLKPHKSKYPLVSLLLSLGQMQLIAILVDEFIASFRETSSVSFSYQF